MLRATSVVRKAAVKADRVVETLTLDHADRNRRRVSLKADGGADILLDLDRPTALADGDAVTLEDGGLVLVRAAEQDLLEITAGNPLRLMRVAWHIGNRHTPAEIGTEAIWIESDHVLAEMIRGQGCAMREVRRAFQPERGAYDHGHHGHDHAAHDHAHGDDCGCGHDHHHDHGHGHAHSQAHAHAHAHAETSAHGAGQAHGHADAHASHSHAHDDACGCGHDHGHHHGAAHGHKAHAHDH